MKKPTYFIKQSIVLSRTSILSKSIKKLRLFKTTPFCYVLEDPEIPNKTISVSKDYLGRPHTIQSRDNKGVFRLTIVRYVLHTDETPQEDFYDCVTDVMADYDVFKNFAVNKKGQFIQRINYKRT